MSILVDELRGYGQAPKEGGERYFGNGKQSCHMGCDGDLEELHKFAERLGLRRAWFQPSRSAPHYDLTPNKRVLAVRLGAQEVTTEALVMAALARRKQGEIAAIEAQPPTEERT